MQRMPMQPRTEGENKRPGRTIRLARGRRGHADLWRFIEIHQGGDTGAAPVI